MYMPIFHHTPKVRNKTSYEAPSFHTSGTPRNVPYTILTRDQMTPRSFTTAEVGSWEFHSQKVPKITRADPVWRSPQAADDSSVWIIDRGQSAPSSATIRAA